LESQYADFEETNTTQVPATSSLGMAVCVSPGSCNGTRCSYSPFTVTSCCYATRVAARSFPQHQVTV
jgi:hypothetical protein